MARQTNIRRRGNSWVCYFRIGGRQIQRSFADRDYGGTAAAREAARLWFAQSQAKKLTGQFRAPVNVTFREAAEEWLRHGRQERNLKHSTLADYRWALDCHILPAFGDLRIRDITAPMIERWRGQEMTAGRLGRRTANKTVTMMSGILERARRVYGLSFNPVADVEKYPSRCSGDLDFYTPEEVWSLVRAAESDQDAAIFLTAAFTGLRRGELVALGVKDVDFEQEAIRVRSSFTYGALSTPKSGKVRTVPMVPEVAQVLAKLLAERNPGEDELVFPGEGGYLDGSALRRRYVKAQKKAKLRLIRFHDLRHTFGSLAIDRASIVDVQAWMGHADVQTTMRYLHHKSRSDDAKRLAEAFKVKEPDPLETLVAA